MGRMVGLKNRSSFCAVKFVKPSLQIQAQKGRASFWVLIIHGQVCGIRTLHGLRIRITLYKYYFDMCKKIHLYPADAYTGRDLSVFAIQ